jgi:Ubiquitin family
MADDAASPIEIAVRTLININHRVAVGDSESTIWEVMDVIESQLGIARPAQRLLLAGLFLEPDRTLGDFNVQNGQTFYLIPRNEYLHIDMSLLEGQEPNWDAGLQSGGQNDDEGRVHLHSFVLNSNSDRFLGMDAGQLIDYCCGFPRIMAVVPLSVTNWELRRSRWNGSDERAGERVGVSTTLSELLAEIGPTPPDEPFSGPVLLLQPDMSSKIKSVHKS